MLRRLLPLVSALVMTCALGLASDPTGTVAAGGYGVGPSQTGATGTARACEATALNHGLSTANGVQCVAGTPSLAFSFDQATCDLTLAGSDLIGGSEVWFYSQTFDEYFDGGMMSRSGKYFVDIGSVSSGFSDTLTPYAFPAGVDPNVDTTATPYFIGPTLSFSC